MTAAVLLDLREGWPFPRLNETRNACPVTWAEVSAEFADDMLNVLPPIYVPGGFMVSEPAAHRSTGESVHTGIVERGVRFFATECARSEWPGRVAALDVALISAACAPNLRWVVMHKGRDGLFVLTLGQQGRWTFGTQQEAQQRAETLRTANTPERLAEVYGPHFVETVHARLVECWPQHNDPKAAIYGEAVRS